MCGGAYLRFNIFDITEINTLRISNCLVDTNEKTVDRPGLIRV